MAMAAMAATHPHAAMMMAPHDEAAAAAYMHGNHDNTCFIGHTLANDG